MYIDLQSHPIDRLRVLVRDIKRIMEASLGYSPHGIDDMLTADSLRSFLSEHNVHIIKCRLGAPAPVMALLLSLPDCGHVIMIDEGLFSYAPDVQKKYLKYLFCHELAHIVMNHDGADLVVLNQQQTNLNALFHSMIRFTTYLISLHEREEAAEIFAVALGFWPHTEFLRLLKRTPAQFRMIANLYKMPVDCAVKWALVNYHDQMHMHYFKRNEKNKMIMDRFWPAEPDWLDEGESSLFDTPWTAAHEASKRKSDSDKIKREQNGPGADYACIAIYDREEDGFMRKGDRVIVAGFRRREFELFVA